MGEAPVKIHLYPKQFSSCETLFVSVGKLDVIGFIYPSGVRALRIKNTRGEVVVLPFHGQQVWEMTFDDRLLKMRTAVREPKQTQDFLSNMGSFLFHCGMSAMGSPGPDDNHPIHGELVNAHYQSAYIDAGEDENGVYVSVGGIYEHSAAFGYHYTANPTMRVYENDSLVHFSMRVRNLNQTPMEYMYLAHINFMPVDYGRLVYSAKYDTDHVKVRASFPSHMQPSEKLKNFLTELVNNPKKHHVIAPDFTFDPEIVFMVDYEVDADGWAHALHIHPDGSADYVRHKPEQLNHGVRWISRTPNQQALGMEAGTAGVEGYTAERAKGNIKVLAPNEEFFCEFVAGLKAAEDVKELEKEIDAQMGRK